MIYYHALYRDEIAAILEYTNFQSDEEVNTAIRKDGGDPEDYIIVTTKEEIE